MKIVVNDRGYVQSHLLLKLEHLSAENKTRLLNCILFEAKNKSAAPLNIETFLEFCNSEKSTENVEFVRAIYERKQSINDMMQEFIVPGSPKSVNLSASTVRAIHDGQPNAWNLASAEIVSLIKSDTFERFLSKIITMTKLSTSKNIALWCFKTQSKIEPFCSFPSSVNVAESRISNIVNGVVLVGIALLLDVYCNFPFVYIYIAYGYFVRCLCGPRLDPNAFFVLFILQPLVVDKFNWLENEFVNGKTKQFVQLIGLCFSFTATLLRLTNFSHTISFVLWGCIMFASSCDGIFVCKKKCVDRDQVISV